MEIVDVNSNVVSEMKDIYDILFEFKKFFSLEFSYNNEACDLSRNMDLACVQVTSFQTYGSFRDRYSYSISVVKENFDFCESLYNKRFKEFKEFYKTSDGSYNFERSFLSNFFFEVVYKIVFYAYAEIYFAKATDFERTLFNIRNNLLVIDTDNREFDRADIFFDSKVGVVDFKEIKIPSKFMYSFMSKFMKCKLYLLHEKLMEKAKQMCIDGVLDEYDMHEYMHYRSDTTNTVVMKYDYAYKIAKYTSKGV